MSKVPATFGISCEGIAGDHADDVGEAGALDVGRRFFGADRVVFDGDQPAAGLAQAHADPDAGVAAGRADFEHRLGVGRADQDAQEPAILFGDGQLALVGGPDGVEELLQRRTRLNDRGGWCFWRLTENIDASQRQKCKKCSKNAHPAF